MFFCAPPVYGHENTGSPFFKAVQLHQRGEKSLVCHCCAALGWLHSQAGRTVNPEDLHVKTAIKVIHAHIHTNPQTAAWACYIPEKSEITAHLTSQARSLQLELKVKSRLYSEELVLQNKFQMRIIKPLLGELSLISLGLLVYKIFHQVTFMVLIGAH